MDAWRTMLTQIKKNKQLTYLCNIVLVDFNMFTKHHVLSALR